MTEIVALLMALFKAIPGFESIIKMVRQAFTKTPEEKTEESEKSISDAIAKEQQSGRPE